MKRTDNLEAMAREWLRENHPYTHDVHEQITKLAAFARSLATPSGAVEAARKLLAALDGWDLEYVLDDGGSTVEAVDVLRKALASPSVEPTVDEQVERIMEVFESGSGTWNSVSAKQWCRERLKALLSK